MVSVIPFSAHFAFPQTADDIKSLRDEIKALKEGQSAIQRDLEEIKRLLRTRQAPTRPPSPPEFKETLVDIRNGHVRGDKDTKLVMIEFSDYQCPFCGKFVRETMPQIQKGYIDTGKIRYVFMDFPLPMHAQAMKASEAALCAGDQDKFWEMHDRRRNSKNAGA